MANNGTFLGYRRLVDFYDIFGYLIPGIISFVLLPPVLKLDYPSFVNEIAKLINPSVGSKYWVTTLFVLCLLLIVIYTFGHVIASLGSIVLDRCFVKKTLGYPFEYVLRLSGNREDKNSIAIRENRLIFYIIEAILLCTIFKHLWCVMVLCLILILLLGLLLSSKIIREINKTHSCKWCSWNNSQWYKKSVAYCYKVIVRPQGYIIYSLLTLWRAFDGDMKDNFQQYFNAVFKLDSNSVGTENFWLPAIYLEQEAPVHYYAIRKFLSLFGFARNTSMALFMMLLVYVCVISQGYVSFKLALWALANVFLLRFLYLYINYYTKYTFRAFVVVASQKELKGTIG